MSRKIKVIELINGVVDGGAETIVKDYMLHLDKKIFRSVVLACYVNLDSANAKRMYQNNVHIYTPFKSKRNILCKIINKLQRIIIPQQKREAYYTWYIQKFIMVFKPDVIHVHMSMLHYLVPIADKLKRVKIFYTCHSLPERYFNYQSEIGSVQYNAAKYLIKNNQLQLIALHSEMQQTLNTMFGVDNTIVLNNLFDIRKFQDVSKSKNQIRQQIRVPCDAFVIGHVGRFFYIKNQMFLIDVFKDVAKKKSNAYLLMIGDGESAEEEKKLASYGLQNRYTILRNRCDVNELLHAMDVFVFPSLLEGMPGALIEAQAAGLKCIASSAITSEAIVSNMAILMDLEAGAEKWAERILNNEFNGKPKTDLMSFDVHHVMKQIEQLYLSEK